MANGLWMHARVSEERSPEERPAVILVHELIGSSRYMVPTLRQLVPRHRVYAPDLLGFDKSASTPRPERVRALLRFSRLDGDGWSKECGACRQLLWLPDHSRPRHTQPQARRADRAARPDDGPSRTERSPADRAIPAQRHSGAPLPQPHHASRRPGCEPPSGVAHLPVRPREPDRR